MQTEMAKEVYALCEKISTELDYTQNDVAIILAAGHGKRIKSQKSKMSIFQVVDRLCLDTEIAFLLLLLPSWPSPGQEPLPGACFP